jgi:rhodanese-related sulfurtransferase
MQARLTPEELSALLEAQAIPRNALIDVREPWEYELTHIEGSRLIPLGQLHERLGELAPDAELVLICHHGVRSLMGARFLRASGFARVSDLKGGIDAWARRIDRSLPTY